ncbi:hypothetical protein T492DRAFT_886997 [Pavlovales sp. CCMP2436]|nr:hypothetical protein T492DRAFT_886997 [Pavlovales sp. CCMP2436]
MVLRRAFSASAAASWSSFALCDPDSFALCDPVQELHHGRPRPPALPSPPKRITATRPSWVDRKLRLLGDSRAPVIGGPHVASASRGTLIYHLIHRVVALLTLGRPPWDPPELSLLAPRPGSTADLQCPVNGLQFAPQRPSAGFAHVAHLCCHSAPAHTSQCPFRRP